MEATTIAGIASGNPNFTTLVTALSCTGLVGAVDNKDPNAAKLTVFAPTNAAFGKLGLNAKNICWLPKSLLTKILTYHVAPGALIASDVVSAKKIQMLNGLYVVPSVRTSGAYLNWYAKISATDIHASNGVIHVIDAVLIPYSVR
jgi:uncharacterized surface protein with fasciclin (FAS1) repeats